MRNEILIIESYCHFNIINETIQIKSEINKKKIKEPDLKDCIQDKNKPDYENLSDGDLKAELKKYGLKPGSKKYMVKQLEDMWKYLNSQK